MSDLKQFDGEFLPPSDDKPVPKFLKITYCLLPVWGIFAFFLFWNGTGTWFGNTTWQELQEAADTTYIEPSKTHLTQE